MLLHPAKPAFGDRIGRYRLLAEIARGGMGIVYVAAAQGPAGFTKVVAIKELQPDLVRDTDFLTMFLDEARVAARLNHSNIVQTLDVSESNGRHFIAMEYLEGRSLHQVLRRFAKKGGFPLRLALTILRDALSGLDYAHELTDGEGRRLGFVHRDMSPQNIFVTYDGHAKIIDFGIAKARDSSIETKTGVLKGRTHYMAPEQLTHQADRRTDIFAVGVILFEIVAGRRLWKGMTDIEILARLLRSEVPSLNTARSEIPAPLWQICQTALQAKPEHRFATAAEMRDALDEYLWQTGGIPRPREVADALTAEFAAERQHARDLIDAALARLSRGGEGHLEALATPEPTQRSTPSVLLSVPSGTWGIPGPPLTPLPQTPFERLLGMIREHRLTVGAALLVMAAIALAVALHHPAAPLPEPPTASVAVPPPPPSPSPAAPPAVDSIQLSIAVSPPHAQLILDGETLPSNPFMARFPRSTELHRLRVVAPGFEPRERLISFADNVMLDLSLTAKPVVAQREAAPSRPEPPPPPAPARRESARDRDRGSRSSHASPPPARPAPPPPPPVVAPPPPPPPAPRSSAPTDIVPRSPGDAPHPPRRPIDSNNPYGDEK